MMTLKVDGEVLEQGELVTPTSIVCRQSILPRETFVLLFQQSSSVTCLARNNLSGGRIAKSPWARCQINLN